MQQFGARGPLGNIEAFYTVDPHELPWNEDFLHPDIVRPAEFGNYSAAGEAFRLIEHILCAGIDLWEYPETGTTEYATQPDISQAGIYGVNEQESWPYNYVFQRFNFYRWHRRYQKNIFQKFSSKNRFTETVNIFIEAL